MDYLLVCLFGVGCGALLVYFLLEGKRKKIADAASQNAALLQESLDLLATVERGKTELASEQVGLNHRLAEFERKVVTYSDLASENGILKRDLRNLALEVRKFGLDGEARDRRLAEIQAEVESIGSRYLRDNVKWISTSLTSNNFVQCKQRLLDVISRCRRAGLDVPLVEEESLLERLREEFKKVVRLALEREEQARIKAQIREELLRQKEIERELKQLEREREAIEAALRKALAEAQDEHSEEVRRLKERLAEAEARTQRAISQAQLTKAGYVYVISNLGSFGDNVYKIGMTRRLEPLQRVRELGDASVPFPFDVHAMISSDNAPALEYALHRALCKKRLNKVNPRKEYFRVDLESILVIVTEHHGEVEYVAEVEALEYRQSLAANSEDLEFIEDVFESLEDEYGFVDES